MGILKNIKEKFGLKKRNVNPEFEEKKNKMIAEYEACDYRDYHFVEEFEAAENAGDYGIKGFSTTRLMIDGKLIVMEDIVPLGGKFMPIAGYPCIKILEKTEDGYKFKMLSNNSLTTYAKDYVFEGENQDGYYSMSIPKVAAEFMMDNNYQEIADCFGQLKIIQAEIGRQHAEDYQVEVSESADVEKEETVDYIETEENGKYKDSSKTK